MDSWRTINLAEVVTLQRGHDLPSQERGEGEVPIIGSFGITGTHDEAKYQGPGVAIGRSGASIGVATYCKSDYWPLNTCLFVKNFRGNDPRWVYYLLDSIDFTAYNSGSAQPSLNRNYLANIRIALPPLPEQRAIAEVLGALDDKIESNRRIWKLRLELAGSAFRRAAKEAETTTPLGELYEVGLSGVWGQDEPGGKATVATSCLRGRDLEDFVAGGVVESPVRFISEKQLSSRVFQNGEIWTAGSGSLGPSLLITEGVARLWENQLTYSNFVKRLVPIGGHDMAEVAWNAVVDTWRNDGFAAFRTGTAMPNLDPSALLAGVQVPVVANESREEIALLTNAALDPQVLMENLALARLRDTLLPALLSGRIRVPAAAELVEAS